MSDTPPPAGAPAPEPFAPMATTLTIQRRPDEVPRDRQAHVTHLLKEVKAAKEHFADDFKRMRDDQDFAAGLQYPGQTRYDDDKYVLNLVLRHVRLRTANLYAKNPKAVYERKRKLDFVLWDEKPDSIAAAQMLLQPQPMPAVDPMTDAPAGPMPPPVDPTAMMQAQMLLQDYREGMAARQMAERIGRTLELLWDHFIAEPTPNVKIQMKAWVRRAITCGVSYAKLRYQQVMETTPDGASTYADLTQQLAVIERLRARLSNPDAAQEVEYEAEQLRQALASLQGQEQIVAREGPLLDFPRSTAVIPSIGTRSLRGWIGCGWMAEEFCLPAPEVQEIYSLDLNDMAMRAYAADQSPPVVTMRDGVPHVRFWEVYDKRTRRLYTVGDGWPDYFREPHLPSVDLEQFFPYHALTFNDIEHEKRLFPPSDVELLRHPQREYNRTRQALRVHRIANRPGYVAANGAFDKDDIKSLSDLEDHGVAVLNNLKEGQSVGDLLQPIQKVPVDPNVYEVEGLFADTQRATGSQEANLGGTSGASATEVSVAEGSRQSDVGSDADALDETLTDIARDFGKVCLARLPAETVKRIAGRGAVWPEMSRDEIAAEVILTVEAGSSGRPNRAADLANLERALPYVIQIPGIKPEKLGKHVLKVLDDRLDLTDWFDSSLPAITAMNRSAGPVGAGPNDPMSQGPAGADNAPNPQQTPGGPQAAFGPSGNSLP